MKQPTSVTRGGICYSVGDDVLLHPEHGGEPYVGCITAMRKTQGLTELQIQWFYRPEDTCFGRKSFHGQQELYRSNHSDWVDVRSLLSKCTVLPFKVYVEEQRDLEAKLFYTRFTYRPDSNDVVDEPTPVYCVCSEPYNPDKMMIKCVKCEDWFHPRCLKMTERYARSLKDYVCEQCKQDVAGKADA